MVSSKPTDIPTALSELSRLQAHCVCLSVYLSVTIEEVVNLGIERGMGTREELEVGTREVGMLWAQGIYV